MKDEWLPGAQEAARGTRTAPEACKGRARDTGEAAGSAEEAAVASGAEKWLAGAPSGFRIRNQHFVSGIAAMGSSPGAQEAAEAARMTNTASDAAGEPRRTMGKQSDALRSPQERDEPRKRPLSAHYVFRIRNCGLAAAPGAAITTIRLDMRDLTITYTAI